MRIRSKKNLRLVSAFVLTSFSGSLVGPAFAAGVVPAPVTKVADQVGAASTRALAELWAAWSKSVAAVKGAKSSLTSGYAASFFKQRGATPKQVEILVNNARKAGHLVGGSPTAAQASKTMSERLKGLFKRSGNEPVAKAPKVEATKAVGLTGKVKGFFSRFKPSPKMAGTASTGSSMFPIPGGGTTAPSAALGTVDPSLYASAAGKVKGVAVRTGHAIEGAAAKTGHAIKGAAESTGNFISRTASKTGNAIKNAAARTKAFVKGAADTAVVGTKRGVHAVGSTAQTGYLTAKYALDPRPYYKIPIHGDTVLKVRGVHKSTVAFKEGKWTTKDFSYKSTWPPKGDLAARVDSMAAAQQPKGFFGKIVAKFKGMTDSVKTRMRGEANITKDTRAEIQRLEISNNLIDQARTLSDAQRAIKVRVDQMKHTSESLRKPLDTAKVEAMEKQYRALEKTKKDLLHKANGSLDSKATAVVKDAAKWALYSVGITASINLIRQAFTEDGIDIGEAFGFMAQPSFWGGTAGGFLGSALFSTLAVSIMPPGVGIFMKVLPGFLGAALGFEVGGSFFGGEMDLVGTLMTTLASAGGYSLAWTMLGGTAAPAIALIGAAIAAGSLAGFILDKFRGGPESESYILPESPIDEMNLADAQPLASVEPGEGYVTPEVLSQEQMAAASMSPVTAVNLAAAQQQVDQAYNAYITFLKGRKIPEATAAHKSYMDSMKALELAKSNASAGK
jgi:hypothetical protein